MDATRRGGRVSQQRVRPEQKQVVFERESQRGPEGDRKASGKGLAPHVVVWDSTGPAVCLGAGVTWQSKSTGHLVCVFSLLLLSSKTDSGTQTVNTHN